jgi:hypothetical protein
MSMVMVRCPRLGRPISTGIETDLESFKSIPDVLSKVYCADCGLEHVWWPREAFLEETAGHTPEAIIAG